MICVTFFHNNVSLSPQNKFIFVVPLIKHMSEPLEIAKSKSFIVVEIIEYIPNSVVIKTIIKKTTAFDTFIQVIDGQAEIVINDKSHVLEIGQAMIIPAHARHTIKANVRFKMLSTIIKSGYEE